MGNGKVVWHSSSVSRERREAVNGHAAAVVWLTGLPGSGKSTIAHAVENQLFLAGCQTFVLDGDNVRHGLSSDLGFSPADRREHLRRTGELVKLLYNAGMIVLGAFVSPTRDSRATVRNMIRPGPFIEVYCKCAVDVCERRDTKGFYAGARAGQIPDYTGISAPYEEPLAPELTLNTMSNAVEPCTAAIIELLRGVGVIDHDIASRASRQNGTAA